MTVRSWLGLAVRVTIMRGTSPATPRCRPWRARGARRRATPSSVMTTSMSPGDANRTGRLEAELRGVGERDDQVAAADDRSLDRCLVGVGGGEPVVGGDAVGAEEGDVDAKVGERLDGVGDRRPPGWSAGRGRGGVAASRWGRPASRAAIGTAWVTTVSSRSGGRRVASRTVVDPASSRIVPPAGGRRSRAARAMRSLVSVLTWSRSRMPDSMRDRELGGTTPPWTRRTRPRPLEGGQIATHGLRGDVVLTGQLVDRHAARAG